MNLAKYAIENQKVIYFFLALLLIGGILSFDKLGKKEDAPFVIKTVVLTTQYPGATPAEVEELITEPIEREIQSMRLVDQIKSESYYGLSKITLDLEPATSADEIPQLWDELRRKVLNIQPQLPEGASAINVADDFGDVFGIYYGLVADEGFTYKEMRDAAENIKKQLVTIDGVTKVDVFGEQTEVVNIFVSSAKLASIGVQPNDIMQILEMQNKMVSSGDRLAGDMQLKIVASGTYKSLDDIRNQLINTPSGTQVRLGDIALVETGYMDPPTTIMSVNGKRAIGIGVSTDPERDVVKAGRLVDDKLAEYMPQIPAGMELVDLYPENVIADEANNGFLLNLVESLVIVVLIIMLVMGFRAGMLIGTSLLFSIGGTLLIMQLMNVGLNRTSLAGFIIAMGMLVDNAIVVTDNAQISMLRGVPRKKALVDGATGPQWGLLGATLIAVISFLPMYLAPSSVAEIVKPLFVVLAISLSLSWVLALTQTVTFGNFILKEPKGEAKDPYGSKFYQWFAGIIENLIHHRWITLSSVVVLLVVSLIVLSKLPQNFFPNMDKPYFRADLFMPDGYNIRQMQEKALYIENEWKKNPAIKNVSITMGNSPLRYYLASASFGPKSNYANVLVELNNSDSTAYYEEAFDVWMRSTMPDMLCRSGLFKLSPVPDALIEIGFIGHNIDTLTALTQQVEDIMRANSHVQDVRRSWGYPVPTWEPIYSQESGQRLGISRQTAAQFIKIATTGLTLGEYREGDQLLPILLKDNAIDSFNLSNLATIPVFSNTGQTVPLEQVMSDSKFQYNYSVIRRYDRERMLLAQCDPLRGGNTAAAFKEVIAEVHKIPLPEGYSVKYIGEQDSQDDSNAALVEYLPLTFILIFSILLFLFRTYLKPLVIIAMLPLIFIGVVLGLATLGKSLDFFAMLGLLGLIGMNIKNAIVLVDQIGIEIDGGLKPFDAVVTATKSRIVPVSMASGTTILGMLPLLFDSMFGGMAATIMGGLLAASLLTLVVLPVAYCAVHKIY